MNTYKIEVSFEAEDDAAAIGVMEYLDVDLVNTAELEGVDAESIATTMPSKFVPARWSTVSQSENDE